MPVSKHEVEATLAMHDADALLAILNAAQVSPRGATTSAQLAHRITDALWWNYSTPLGYVSGRVTFDKIVHYTIKRLKMTGQVADGNPWWRLEQLTGALALDCLDKHGVSVEDLDPKTRDRVVPRWWPTFALGSGATGSFGVRWTSGKVLDFLKGPIGRLLPLIPPIAPYYHIIKNATSTVNVVAGPLAIGLAVLTLNESLGANERRLIPLLLGVGALGPDPVEEAFEVADTPDESEASEHVEHVEHVEESAPEETDVLEEAEHDGGQESEPEETDVLEEAVSEHEEHDAEEPADGPEPEEAAGTEGDVVEQIIADVADELDEEPLSTDDVVDADVVVASLSPVEVAAADDGASDTEDELDA